MGLGKVKVAEHAYEELGSRLQQSVSNVLREVLLGLGDETTNPGLFRILVSRGVNGHRRGQRLVDQGLNRERRQAGRAPMGLAVDGIEKLGNVAHHHVGSALFGRREADAMGEFVAGRHGFGRDRVVVRVDRGEFKAKHPHELAGVFLAGLDGGSNDFEVVLAGREDWIFRFDGGEVKVAEGGDVGESAEGGDSEIRHRIEVVRYEFEELV